MTNLISTTIGCDLGDKRSELCVLTADGSLSRPRSIASTPAGFRKYFGELPRTHVVIEVGSHSRWVSELLKKLGHRVTVANARRLKLISENNRKTDRNDAELLARMGRADPELLAPITHRGSQAQADLAIAKARDVLVTTRTRLVNAIRGTVKAFGERLSSSQAESFHRKTRSEVPEILKPALEPLYAVLERLEEQIKTCDRELEALVKRYPDVEVISQPNGVGTLTALVFQLTLEDKTRFQSSRMAGAFIGLTPRKDQSGASDKQLSITKAGDPFLRRLLVQCGNYILGPFGTDSDLRRWGLELSKRGGANSRKRAKVAVARKLAVLMHRLWVTGEEYEPLRQAKRRAA